MSKKTIETLLNELFTLGKEKKEQLMEQYATRTRMRLLVL